MRVGLVIGHGEGKVPTVWSDLSALTYQSFGFRRGDLPARSREARERLRSIDVGLGVEHNDRVRAAILLAARGRAEDFADLCDLARCDWRDVLVLADLDDDPDLWRPLVAAILRWRGNADTFLRAPEEAFGDAALALAKAWIGPMWRTDPMLRPVLDHLSQRPFDEPPRLVANLYGDASVWSSELLDDGELADEANRWRLLGHDPSQLTRVVDDVARVVYVNAYGVRSQREAVDALSGLERVTMWRGLRVSRFDARSAPAADRFDIDAELRGS